MKYLDPDLLAREENLSRLAKVCELLLRAAEHIGQANADLRLAKDLTSQITDPEVRRIAMRAAGHLKATNHGFFAEEEPCHTPTSAATRRTGARRRRTSRVARVAGT